MRRRLCKVFVCDLGCASKIVEAKTPQFYSARRLANAGLKLAAAMMIRTRVIRRYDWVAFTLLRCRSVDMFFSCCGSVAAPQNL
jgi:hypothetical protein